MGKQTGCRSPIAANSQRNLTHQPVGIEHSLQPAASRWGLPPGRTAVTQQKIATLLEHHLGNRQTGVWLWNYRWLTRRRVVLDLQTTDLTLAEFQLFGQHRHHPDIDLIQQSPQGKVVVKCPQPQVIGIVFNDAIGPSPDGAGRKVSALPMIGRQHHGHDIGQQPG